MKAPEPVYADPQQKTASLSGSCSEAEIQVLSRYFNSGGNHHGRDNAFPEPTLTLTDIPYDAQLIACTRAAPACTIAWFAPHIIKFQQTANTGNDMPALAVETARWRRLSYIRVAVFVAVSTCLLPLCLQMMRVGINKAAPVRAEAPTRSFNNIFAFPGFVRLYPGSLQRPLSVSCRPAGY